MSVQCLDYAVMLSCSHMCLRPHQAPPVAAFADGDGDSELSRTSTGTSYVDYIRRLSSEFRSAAAADASCDRDSIS